MACLRATVLATAVGLMALGHPRIRRKFIVTPQTITPANGRPDAMLWLMLNIGNRLRRSSRSRCSICFNGMRAVQEALGPMDQPFFHQSLLAADFTASSASSGIFKSSERCTGGCMGTMTPG